MGHINQPGPTGQITRFLALPLAYPLAYATIAPPPGSECRKYYRGILRHDRFSGCVPFPRDNGNGLKTNPTGMLVRLFAKILCLPSQTSFVTICFGFVLEFFPSNLPRFQRERSQRKARADFEKGTPKCLCLWTTNLMIFKRYTSMGSNSLCVFKSNLSKIRVWDWFSCRVIKLWESEVSLNF